jgi:flagellar motor switch/type III secretory pathway protein FliN
VTVPVMIEVGRTHLPTADLARLRRHAVLLIDTAAPMGGRWPFAAPQGRGEGQHPVVVRAGVRRELVARALWQPPGRLRRQALCAVAMSPPPSFVEGKPMSAQAERSSAPAGSAPQDDAAEPLALGPVEVEVRFELARQHWSLHSLSQWRVGEALPFDMALTQATVGAWIHDRCVASGRLVVVGDRLGLRIDALHAQPTAAAQPGPAAAHAPAGASPQTGEPGETGKPVPPETRRDAGT